MLQDTGPERAVRRAEVAPALQAPRWIPRSPGESAAMRSGL